MREQLKGGFEVVKIKNRFILFNKCIICEKLFQISPCEIKRKSCGSKCGILCMSRTKKGKPSGREGKRKHKTEPKVCPICGTVFERPPSITYNAWERRICCSRNCFWLLPISEEAKKKNSDSNTGKKRTEEHKENYRNCTIKRIEKRHGICFPNYNINACKLFEELNKKYGLNLHHAENGGEIRIIGYYLDAVDIENCLIIEYDEKHHNKIKQKEKDEIRQSNLIRETGFTFIRVNKRTMGGTF